MDFEMEKVVTAAWLYGGNALGTDLCGRGGSKVTNFFGGIDGVRMELIELIAIMINYWVIVTNRMNNLLSINNI